MTFGSVNNSVTIVVPSSAEPGKSRSSFMTGTAARIGATSEYVPSLTAWARCTAFSFVGWGKPAGLR